MSQLIRMDQTGHTTLAEWTDGRPAERRSGRGGAARRARARLLRGRLARRGQRRAGPRAARRRTAGDPPPADRRRLSAVSAARRERTAGRARTGLAARRGGAARARERLLAPARDGPVAAAHGRLWTAITVAHTVPFVAVAGLLLVLNPATAAVALMALAQAWIIPELYAARGANVVRPRAPRRRARGARVGRAARRPAWSTTRASCIEPPAWCSSAATLGVWLDRRGRGGARAPGRAARALLLREGRRRRSCRPGDRSRICCWRCAPTRPVLRRSRTSRSRALAGGCHRRLKARCARCARAGRAGRAADRLAGSLYRWPMAAGAEPPIMLSMTRHSHLIEGPARQGSAQRAVRVRRRCRAALPPRAAALRQPSGRRRLPVRVPQARLRLKVRVALATRVVAALRFQYGFAT